MVGFQIGLPVFGDIAVGVWFGDHKSELDTPALAYVCHTAFLDVRFCKSAQFDCPRHHSIA